MIAARPDLLIVGGLAIDRGADASAIAGRTVLHGARAVTAAGWHVATVTAAGPEPEALAALNLGMAQLPAIGAAVAGTADFLAARA